MFSLFTSWLLTSSPRTLIASQVCRIPPEKKGHVNFRSDSQKTAWGTTGHVGRPWDHLAPCKHRGGLSLWDWGCYLLGCYYSELQSPWKSNERPGIGEDLQVCLSLFVLECWLEHSIPVKLMQCILPRHSHLLLHFPILCSPASSSIKLYLCAIKFEVEVTGKRPVLNCT